MIAKQDKATGSSSYAVIAMLLYAVIALILAVVIAVVRVSRTFINKNQKRYEICIAEHI